MAIEQFPGTPDAARNEVLLGDSSFVNASFGGQSDYTIFTGRSASFLEVSAFYLFNPGAYTVALGLRAFAVTGFDIFPATLDDSFILNNVAVDMSTVITTSIGNDNFYTGFSNTQTHRISLGGGQDRAVVNGREVRLDLGANNDGAINLAPRGWTLGRDGQDAIFAKRADGGAGDDYLAGLGDSTLRGGLGADTFATFGQGNSDVALIRDFNPFIDSLAMAETDTVTLAGVQVNGQTMSEVIIDHGNQAQFRHFPAAYSSTFQFIFDPSELAKAKFNFVDEWNGNFTPSLVRDIDDQNSYRPIQKDLASGPRDKLSFNFAPEASDHAVAAIEDRPTTIDLLAGARDVNGDDLIVTHLKIESGGWKKVSVGDTVQRAGHTLELLANGKVRLTTKQDFNTENSAPLTFQYRIRDDVEGVNKNDAFKWANGKVDRTPWLTDEGLVTVTVAAEPEAVGGTTTISEDAPDPINILANNKAFDQIQIATIEVGHFDGTGAFVKNLSKQGDVLALNTLNQVLIDTAADGSRFDQLDTGQRQKITFVERYTDTDGKVYTATETVFVTGSNDPARMTIPADQRILEITPDGTPSPSFISSFQFINANKISVNYELLKGQLDPNLFFDPEGDPLRVEIGGAPPNWQIYSDGGFIDGLQDIKQLGEGDFADLETWRGEPHLITFTGLAPDNTFDGTSYAFKVRMLGDNDAPEANDDTARTDADQSVLINVLANDVDPDRNDTLSVININAGGQKGTNILLNDGTALSASDGGIVFTPGTRFQSLGDGAEDTFNFTYSMTDAFGERDWARVTVTVSGVNDAPVAQRDDLGTVGEDDTLQFDLIVLTANDFDPDAGSTVTPANIDRIDGKPFNFVTSANQPIDLRNGGTLTLDDNGVLTFDPGDDFDDLDAGMTDTAQFTYRINDGQERDWATATATVVGADDRPEAEDDDFIVDAGSGVTTGNVFDDNGSGADTDPDQNDTFEVTSLFFASNVGNAIPLPSSGATVTVTKDGDISIDTSTAKAILPGEVLADTVPYTITDSDGLTDSAEFTVTVRGVVGSGENTAPSVKNVHIPVIQNGTISAALPITDAEGDDVTASLTTQNVPGSGTASIEGTTFNFDPGDDFDLAPGENVQIGHAYSATDSQGATTGGPDAPEDDGAIIITVTGSGAIEGEGEIPPYVLLVNELADTLLLPLTTHETPPEVAVLLIDQFTLGSDSVDARDYGITDANLAQAALNVASDDPFGGARVSLSGPDGSSAVDDIDLVFIGFEADDLQGATDVFVV